jgi:large repetitive protein
MLPDAVFSPFAGYRNKCALLLFLMAALAAPSFAQLNFTTTACTVSQGPAFCSLIPTGGTPPYTFSFPGAPIPGMRISNAPDLPNNLSGGVTAVIIGIPTASGVQTATVRLVDNAGGSIDKTFTMTVPIVDISGFYPIWTAVGDSVKVHFVGVGGTPPYTFSLAGGTLPAGTSIDPSGLLTGTLLTASSGSFTLRVTDSVGNTNTRGHSFTIRPVRFSNVGNRLLPSGTVSLAYNFTFTAQGGTSPYSFALDPASTIPPGLTFSSNGTLSGTPSSPTYGWPFTINVTDGSGQFNSVRVALAVLPAIPIPLTISSASLEPHPYGRDLTYAITAFGGVPPYTFEYAPGSTVPPGLKSNIIPGPEVAPDWDPQPGYLRGRIRSLGTHAFSVRVTDSAGNISIRDFTLTASPIDFFYRNIPVSPAPTPELGAPYSQRLFPIGGTPPYTVTTLTAPAGITVDNAGLLSGTPQEVGQYIPLNLTLRDSAANETTALDWMHVLSSSSSSLYLNGGDLGSIARGNQYAFTFTANGSPLANPNYSVSVVSGSLPPGLALLTGANFNTTNALAVAQLAGAPTTAGTYSFLLRLTDAAGNIGQRQMTLKVSSLAFLTSGLPTGTVGIGYNSGPLEVRGGTPPYTFSVTSGLLPPGLVLNSASGAITGTPQTSSASTVTFQLSDSAGNSLSRSFTLNLYGLQITSPNLLPEATFGRNYSYTFMGSSPGLTWTFAGGIPAGLTLNSSTGVLSGVVTGTGTFLPSITASNGATSVTKSFTLISNVINNASFLTGFPTTPLELTLNSQVISVLNVTGGVPPYTISTVPGSPLPPGLAIIPTPNLTGATNFGRYALAGVPTAAGSFSFKLNYADSSGISIDRTLAVKVSPISVAATTLRTGLVNTAYSAQLIGVGAPGPFTFTLADTLNNVTPPGLTLAANGTLSGTPTSTGNFTFTVDVSSGGSTRRLNANLLIEAVPGRRIDLAFGPIFGPLAIGRLSSNILTPIGGAGTHTWSVVAGSLPPGLSLITGSSLPASVLPPSAALNGVPTTEGTHNFTLRVDDSTGNFAIRNVTVQVTPLRFGPGNVPYNFGNSVGPFQMGVGANFDTLTLNAASPVSYTTFPAASWPAPGFSLSSSGFLTGNPGEAGNFVIRRQITDGLGKSLNTNLGFIVFPPVRPIGVNGISSFGVEGVSEPDLTLLQPFSVKLNDYLLPGFGTPPFTWSLDSGTLPTGLAIGNGPVPVLSGNPNALGTSVFSLLATDANGFKHILHRVHLSVKSMSISPLVEFLPPAVVGLPYSQQFTAAGGSGNYTYRRAFNGDMPGGLSLSPSGLLSGTPTTWGPFTPLIEAVDTTTGQVFRARYKLIVNPPGAIVPSITLSPTSISLTYSMGNPAPAPISVSVGTTATAFPYTVSTTGGAWLSASPTAGTASGSFNLTLNPAGLAAGVYNGSASVSSTQAANSPLTIPVTFTVSAPAPCSYSLSANSASLLASSSSASFTINTTPTCNWTATSSAPWLSVNSPGSGTGTGSIGFSVEGNTGTTTRTGSINVQGLAFAVTQFGTSCSFTFSPSSLSLPAAAVSAVPVAINASSPACAWTAVSNDPSWITISGAASGTGSGAIALSIPANPSSVARSNTVTAGGQSFTINQAGQGCSINLNSVSDSLSASGGPSSVSWNASASACSWSVDPGPSWITLTSPSSGTGSSTANLTVQPNSATTARSASVLIAGNAFTITQAGLPCSFSLSANNPLQPAYGGTGSIAITASASNCNWTASSNAAWLTPSANSGSGSTSITFTAAPNASPTARGATLTVAGQNLIVNQAGTVCSYSLLSPSASVPSAGGPAAIGVVSPAGCSWTAVSSASWLSVTSNASSSGTANVGFSTEPNTTAADRTGTLSIAGIVFPVTQAAASCTITLGAPSFAAGEFGGASAFNYTTSASGCVHAVQSYASWITVTGNTYSASAGTVNFSIAPNTFAATRSGEIRVGDVSFTVTQAPSSCAYTLSTFGYEFGRLGGDGTIPGTFLPLACGPPPILVVGPPLMVIPGPTTMGPGTFTVNYSVGLYQSFINYIRTAQILVNGQIFTVKQTSY